jgi:glycosyltransferase involved in cell wall biosynthesis
MSDADLFAHTLSPRYGGSAGVGSATRNLASGLRQAGVSVNEVCGHGKYSRFAEEQWDLLTRGNSGNIIFPNYYLPPLGGSRAHKTVIIHDVLYRDIPGSATKKKSQWLDIVFSYLDRRADTLCFISEFSKSSFQNHFPWSKNARSIVVPNSINEDEFFYHPNHSRLTSPLIDIVTVSAYYPHKNFGTVVKLAQALQSEARFTVIGRAPSATELSGLMGDEQFADLPGNIVFTGYLPQEVMIRRIVDSDLFIFPSLYEGFGMPPVEAVALGVPVLASRLPPLSETLSGFCDFINDPLSIEEWVENIRSFKLRGTTESHLQDASANVIRRYSRLKIGTQMAINLALGK